MAAQDLRELTPRIRRAIEGPVPPTSGALSGDQVLAITADAVADIILLTAGEWGHDLIATHRDGTTNVPDEWSVDPGLQFQEESVVAAQTALTFFFHQVKDMKVHETITNEGQTWDWDMSPTLLRDWVKALQDARDKALAALIEEHPALARYASILAVRDRVGAALLEPWTRNQAGLGVGFGLGGGYEDAVYDFSLLLP